MGRPHTSVHHHLQTGVTSSLGSRLVNDPHLHPDHLGADGNGVLDDRGECFFQVDGDSPIPLLLQVKRNAVAFPFGIRRKPDYRNSLGFGENGFKIVETLYGQFWCLDS